MVLSYHKRQDYYRKCGLQVYQHAQTLSPPVSDFFDGLLLSISIASISKALTIMQQLARLITLPNLFKKVWRRSILDSLLRGAGAPQYMDPLLVRTLIVFKFPAAVVAPTLLGVPSRSPQCKQHYV